MTFKREKILSPLHENLARPAHVLQILIGPRQVENAVGATMINAGETVFYGHPTPGLKTFLQRYPEAKPVRVGGDRADFSVEQFLESVF